jgi:phosphocarrier protein HPr
LSIATRKTTIQNAHGMHARPAMQFVELANKFRSGIRVRRAQPDTEVDGKSIMEMIILEAVQGTVLQITADGEDADEAVRELADLVDRKFDMED